MDTARLKIERVRVLLEPDTSDERESEGILNPAVAGSYLLYRAVGPGNYSRVMVAKLVTEETAAGKQVLAKRLGKVALEPEELYEKVDDLHGGIEDPRVTELVDGTYVMFYTGYGRPEGFSEQAPIVAVATSRDGLNWHRRGRITYSPHDHNGNEIDFNIIPNKDVVLFSEKVNDRYALLHRPMFSKEQAAKFQLPWRAIWYAESDSLTGPWGNHKIVLAPKYDWEHEGVGAGVPPIHLNDIWLHVYHGFAYPKDMKPHRRYSAGVFMTAHNDPSQVVFRTVHSLLTPSISAELQGTVPNVVFPTAVWQQNTEPNNLALFWGAADSRIMWGTLHLPDELHRPFANITHTQS